MPQELQAVPSAVFIFSGIKVAVPSELHARYCFLRCLSHGGRYSIAPMMIGFVIPTQRVSAMKYFAAII